MESLEEEDEERSVTPPYFGFRVCFRFRALTLGPSFKKQFSSYLEDGVGSEDVEQIYKNAYAAIREDPAFKPTEKTKDWAAESKKHSTPHLTHAQRKQAIEAKIAKFHAGGEAGEEEEDEE